MEISPELLQRIDAILRKQIGLNAESLGTSGVTAALAQRIGNLGLTAGDDYVARVLRESSELQQLIESVVVPETWFFRDMTPFRCIQQVAKEFARNWRGRPLRVLSIPCSTGEEPYSVAVALLAAGLNPHQFSIDAVDISERSLVRASEGHYSASSFREKHVECQAWRDRFFVRRNDRFHVCSEARQRVNFRHGNLVAADFLKSTAPFDVVLCRNLLIYFDATARQSAMKNLKRLLVESGVLYSGHAEAAAFADAGFRSFDRQFPFAFQHAEAAGVARDTNSSNPLPPILAFAPMTSSRISSAKTDVPPKPAFNLSVHSAKTRIQAPATTPETAMVRTVTTSSAPITNESAANGIVERLQRARQAADQGRLQEAQELAEALTKSHPTVADVWCLLGIVQQARGQSSAAERNFERAVYIDPRHRQSLLHLSLLCQSRGETEKAARYRKRMS